MLKLLHPGSNWDRPQPVLSHPLLDEVTKVRFIGKRTDRMRFPRQVGLDPELGVIVRKRALHKGRTIEMQMVHLLEVGILHDPEWLDNEHQRTEMHGAAPNSTRPRKSEVA